MNKCVINSSRVDIYNTISHLGYLEHNDTSNIPKGAIIR